MPALLPFAQNLPQALQIPQMQPDFSAVQQIAQRANTIFETGLNKIKNNYSSVINAPVTSSRNLQKKEEYIQNFRDGLKKITKENLRMPQNVQQAENLLSPFWQDTIMLKDMALTSEAQAGYSAYNQAVSSTDDKIRASANGDYLKLLNHTVGKLRNGGDDPAFYNNFTMPKYQPYGDVEGHMTKWKIDDQGKSDVAYEVDYQTDPLTGDPVLDKLGRKIPLPDHAIMKITNGLQTLPQKVHLASAVLGDRFNSNYDIKAKNSYNDTFDIIKQQFPNLPDEEITKMVNDKYHTDVLSGINKQKDYYKAASENYQSQIDDLKQQQNTSHGLNPQQEAYLKQLEQVKKDADNRYTNSLNRYNQVNSPMVKSSVTEGYIVNQLASTYKEQDIDKYATVWANDKKSEFVENKNYFKNVEHTDRIRQQNIESSHYKALESHNTNEEFLSAMKIASDDPAMASILKQYGYDIPNTSGAPGMSGMRGAELEGSATDAVQHVDESKIYYAAREKQEKKVADGLYALPTANTTGGLIKAVAGKYGVTPTEFSALQRYQYNSQVHNGIDYNDDGSIKFKGVTKGPDGMLKDEREYKAAISKIATGMGVNPATIKTPSDFTRLLINTIGDNVKAYVNTGIKQEEINKYVTQFTEAKSAYNSVADADRQQEQKAHELADKYPDTFKDALIFDKRTGKKRMVNENDVEPYTFAIEGVGNDGKHHTFTKDMIKKKMLEGNVEYVYKDNREMPGAAYEAVKIDGVDIYPTKVDNRNYQQEFDLQHPSKIGHFVHSDEFGTNPDAKKDIRNRIYSLQHQLGTSLDKVGAARRNLYKNSIPDAEFYTKQTGQVNKIMSYPITGKDVKGNSYESNFNTFSHAVSTGNRVAIEDENGEPITTDETVNKLTELAGMTGDDAYKYIGKDIKQVVADDIGYNKIMVRFNTDEDTKKKFPGMEGKKFYIDVSPATESPRLQGLPKAMNRETNHRIYSDNPDINYDEANELQKAAETTGILRYNQGTKMFDISWQYPIIDETGAKVMNNESISIPDQGYAAASKTFNMYLNRGIQALGASQAIYNAKNGNKVKRN